MYRGQFLAVAALAATALIAGCSGNSVKEPQAEAAAPTAATDDYYEVHHEGRIYVFDDADAYREFLSLDETPFRKVRIGAGPQGETVVFGLTNAEKKMREGIPSVDLFDGKLEPAQPFYGEIQKDGRIYVFSEWKDMVSTRSTGEAALRYTDIGGGPGGKTVVYVLNEENKKHRPDGLIARFSAFHKM